MISGSPLLPCRLKEMKAVKAIEGTGHEFVICDY